AAAPLPRCSNNCVRRCPAGSRSCYERQYGGKPVSLLVFDPAMVYDLFYGRLRKLGQFRSCKKIEKSGTDSPFRAGQLRIFKRLRGAKTVSGPDFSIFQKINFKPN